MLVLIVHLTTEGFEIGKVESRLHEKQTRATLISTATTVRTKNAVNKDSHINPVLHKNDPSISAISGCPGDELALTVTVSVTEIVMVAVAWREVEFIAIPT